MVVSRHGRATNGEQAAVLLLTVTQKDGVQLEDKIRGSSKTRQSIRDNILERYIMQFPMTGKDRGRSRNSYSLTWLAGSLLLC